MIRKGRLTRRDILAGAAAAGGYTLVPDWARAQASPKKLNLAFIGIGNYGLTNLRELSATDNVVAVCDIDWRTKDEVHGRVQLASDVAKGYPQAKVYNDWRVMLREMDKQIDGVVVSTADHVHANAALAAIKLGKHVYCDKPLACTIEEVRAMRAASKKYPHLATATGNVGHASEDVRLIVEWIRDGAIGTVERVDVFQTDWASGARYINPYSDAASIDDEAPVPSEVKWDLFLGPAPYRKYNPMYIPLRWRNWQDFGTGILGDHGPHFLDPVVWALDLEYPESLIGDADKGYTPELTKQMFARYSHVEYRFPVKGSRPAVKLKWWGYDAPPAPEGWPKDQPLPTGGGIFYGTKGTLVYGPVYSSRPGLQKLVWLLPDSLDKSYKRPAKTIHRPTSHWTEWADAAREGKQPSSNWEFGGLLTELCLLGNIAILHAGTELKFDEKARRFANSASANAMFKRPRRKGWELPVV